MNEFKPRIHDEQAILDYILAGDYYIPTIEPLSAYRKTDGRCRGCDRGLEAMLAVGLDQGHKQHCQPRRGNYQE